MANRKQLIGVIIAGILTFSVCGFFGFRGLVGVPERSSRLVVQQPTRTQMPTPTHTPVPTPTHTPRPTRTPLPIATVSPTETPRPTYRIETTPTRNSDLDAALDESVAIGWANDTLQEAKNEVGLDALQGGWQQWYTRQNVVKGFLHIVEGCVIEAQELVDLIDQYEQDAVLKKMYKEYSPNLTFTLAVFKDLEIAADYAKKPGDCQESTALYKRQYSK
jgi:hypothetical protein